MLNSKKKCNFAALFVFSAKTLSIKTQKTHTKHTMVHLTNTLRSATFLLGTAVLMLFFFCAPMHAQTPTFKSTSAYQINASVQTSAVNADAAYQPYRSTIYSPFTGDAPSSGGPSRIGGRRNSGEDEEVEEDGEEIVPGNHDHPSDIMPIGDTIILYLFAGILALVIFWRQRKAKQA